MKKIFFFVLIYTFCFSVHAQKSEDTNVQEIVANAAELQQGVKQLVTERIVANLLFDLKAVIAQVNTITSSVVVTEDQITYLDQLLVSLEASWIVYKNRKDLEKINLLIQADCTEEYIENILAAGKKT